MRAFNPNRKLALAIISLGVVVGFYVLREHWGHVLGAVPYLVLLACLSFTSSTVMAAMDQEALRSTAIERWRWSNPEMQRALRARSETFRNTRAIVSGSALTILARV